MDASSHAVAARSVEPTSLSFKHSALKHLQDVQLPGLRIEKTSEVEPQSLAYQGDVHATNVVIGVLTPESLPFLKSGWFKWLGQLRWGWTKLESVGRRSRLKGVGVVVKAAGDNGEGVAGRLASVEFVGEWW
ncbi:hypothetical protein QQ045_013187 [Rhodiola kirilowii]